MSTRVELPFFFSKNTVRAHRIRIHEAWGHVGSSEEEALKNHGANWSDKGEVMVSRDHVSIISRGWIYNTSDVQIQNMGLITIACPPEQLMLWKEGCPILPIRDESEEEMLFPEAPLTVLCNQCSDCKKSPLINGEDSYWCGRIKEEATGYEYKWAGYTKGSNSLIAPPWCPRYDEYRQAERRRPRAQSDANTTPADCETPPATTSGKKQEVPIVLSGTIAEIQADKQNSKPLSELIKKIKKKK